jgi:chromosome partitioning protein
VDTTMSKTVAFANMKGGVGKTTLAISIAEASVAQGKSVLLIDLDMQINASMTIAGDRVEDMLPWRRQQTIEDYLEERWQNRNPKAMSFVDQSRGVHLLSGSPGVTLFERRMLVWRDTVFAARNVIKFWMFDVLDEARAQYDLIICDCPPGLSLLAEAAVAAADVIVVPQVPDRLSTQGLQLYSKYLREDLELTKVAERTAVFINMMDSRTAVARDYADAIRREATNATFPYRVFQTEYADAVAFKRAMDRPRRLPFREIYADIDSSVLAATRELWKMLHWIED